jgi:fructosamine-3-kinase
MSTLSLRLPESLHKQLRELAQSEGISINQLAASALGEKMAALMTQDYLEQRAQRSSRSKFGQALSKVKDNEPEPRDKL